MNTTIRAQNFDLTPAIDRFVRARLGAALARIDQDVISIDVFVKDTNGPRGGVDKQVSIVVRLRSRQIITVVTTHDDLYAAVQLGIKRTKRAIRRQLQRKRRWPRRLAHEAGSEPILDGGEQALARR